MSEPKIWRACLACYNEGNLAGMWINAGDTDAIEAWQDAHEAKTGHEEYAVHDYDSMVDLGEYPSLEDLAEWAGLVEEQGLEVVKAYISSFGRDYAKVEDFHEAFVGVYDSEVAYAEELLESTGELQSIPEHLRYYFDYEAFARDLFIGGVVSERVSGISGGKIVVFNQNF
jgi:antirestriction protein